MDLKAQVKRINAMKNHPLVAAARRVDGEADRCVSYEGALGALGLDEEVLVHVMEQRLLRLRMIQVWRPMSADMNLQAAYLDGLLIGFVAGQFAVNGVPQEEWIEREITEEDLG